MTRMTPDPALLEMLIRRQLAEALALTEEKIDRDATFDALGLTSVESVGVAASLSHELGRECPPWMLWNYPTIGSLAHRLSVGLSEE